MICEPMYPAPSLVVAEEKEVLRDSRPALHMKDDVLSVHRRVSLIRQVARRALKQEGRSKAYSYYARGQTGKQE